MHVGKYFRIFFLSATFFLETLYFTVLPCFLLSTNLRTFLGPVVLRSVILCRPGIVSGAIYRTVSPNNLCMLCRLHKKMANSWIKLDLTHKNLQLSYSPHLFAISPPPSTTHGLLTRSTFPKPTLAPLPGNLSTPHTKLWISSLLQATTRVGGHGLRISQCKKAVLSTNKVLPFQVDGGEIKYCSEIT